MVNWLGTCGKGHTIATTRIGAASQCGGWASTMLQSFGTLGAGRRARRWQDRSSGNVGTILQVIVESDFVIYIAELGIGSLRNKSKILVHRPLLDSVKHRPLVHCSA